MSTYVDPVKRYSGLFPKKQQFSICAFGEQLTSVHYFEIIKLPLGHAKFSFLSTFENHEDLQHNAGPTRARFYYAVPGMAFLRL